MLTCKREEKSTWVRNWLVVAILFIGSFLEGKQGFQCCGDGTGRDGTVLWNLLPLISRVTGKERKGTLFKCLIVLALEH